MQRVRDQTEFGLPYKLAGQALWDRVMKTQGLDIDLQGGTYV
jgi:hypothetical protein